MTEKEREELIEKITQNIVVACGYRMTPTRWLIVQSHARVLLDVAEPVIREECAQECERRATTIGNGQDEYALACRHIAAAIREGGEKCR